MGVKGMQSYSELYGGFVPEARCRYILTFWVLYFLCSFWNWAWFKCNDWWIVSSVRGHVWRIITVLDWMIGFIDPSLYNLSLNWNPYSAVADLHTFQFTAAHALGFSVSTSRCLVADLTTQELSLQVTIKSSSHFFLNYLGMATQFYFSSLCTALVFIIRFLATDL
jgi:hypothetical protein